MVVCLFFFCVARDAERVGDEVVEGEERKVGRVEGRVREAFLAKKK